MVVPLKTYFPRSNQVIHDPENFAKNIDSGLEKLAKILTLEDALAGLAITNQRSTLVIWNKDTGKIIYPVISWRDSRADTILPILHSHSEEVSEKTGLRLTPYYTGPKLLWLNTQNPEIIDLIRKGKALWGTVNTYIIWKLTNGESYVTDHTNAARTLLFNLKKLSWDENLLKLFQIDYAVPDIVPTQGNMGFARIRNRDVPIYVSIGDQHGAFLGQLGFYQNSCVVNLGTGGFVLLKAGGKIGNPIPGLLQSVGFSSHSEIQYIYEGTINAVGSLFSWMENNLGIQGASHGWKSIQINQMGKTKLLPAIHGLAAPYWIDNLSVMIEG
jgi:glycerol kinase